MQASQQMAFKEWAAICAALGDGRQSLIVRKGGIHEGREGFRVAHDEFWLFPTGFHQQRDEIIPEACRTQSLDSSHRFIASSPVSTASSMLASLRVSKPGSGA